MGKIFVVGIGPGDNENITKAAEDALSSSDVIVGYHTYIDLIKDRYPDKELICGEMGREKERCQSCLSLAKEGKTVSLICSGDPGIYGMSSPMLEMAQKDSFNEVTIIPGITAASSGAALLGAPIGHDLCIISLSDRLTPWELIEKRLRLAAEADLAIVLYNPSSHGRKDYLQKACDILLKVLPGERPCGYVRNIGREGTSKKVLTLAELREEEVDMFTTVFIGNSRSLATGELLITPRGYF